MIKQHRCLSIFFAFLLSMGLLFALAGTASAHAKVISSDPGIGATVASAPTKVTVTTVQNMNPDPTKTYLQVYGPSGELVSQGDSKVALSNPKEMAVTIKPDGNGVYIVRWATLSSEDNEADEGAFSFTVNPNAKGSTTASGAQPNAPATTTGTNGVPLWVPIVSAVVALLVGLGAGMGLNRRRPAPSSVGTMHQAIKDQQEDTSAHRP